MKKEINFKNIDKLIKQRYKKHKILSKNIQSHLKELEDCLNKIVKSEGVYEGRIYRFYHYSFKVYWLKESVKEIVNLLKKINPNKNNKFCDLFEEILRDCEKVGDWELKHNDEWSKNTRPIVEAFLHSKYFLEMAVICGREQKQEGFPEGGIYQRWASLLELYNIR